MTDVSNDDLKLRAAVHAALGDPTRLAIAEWLVDGDRTPSEISERLGLTPNLLSHHLAILEHAGVVDRRASSGDGRRRYVRLRPETAWTASLRTARASGRVLFVCTRNSARSQLAAALWRHHLGAAADSAGTDPADRVHPGAVAVAAQAGLDLTNATPRALTAGDMVEEVITVCDEAHEVLGSHPGWRHWSVPDPVRAPDRATFADAFREIEQRVLAFIPDRAS